VTRGRSPEYASVGLTEAQARQQYDCAVAVVQYDDLLRSVADNRPDGFCKLIVERRHRYVLGVHVIGEYSVEIIQMVAACMASGMRSLACSQTTPFYPQRGIAFSCIFDYSHSHEEIRKERQDAQEYRESIDRIEH
jgi:pyruvate/2-oxoglutarate dehydrogenase complex dihydrolipoamide dehydrogenase (E3) component